MELTDMQAVLLDMDGTLVDSDAAVERAWRAWAAEYGVDLNGALAIDTAIVAGLRAIGGAPCATA